MTVVNVTLPSDGTTADVSDYNGPINVIVAALNGNLDDNNISGLSGTKITDNTIPSTKFNAATLQGWLTGRLAVPNTITYLGQHSYQMVFNGVNYSTVLSNGMRVRGTRSTAVQVQSTQLNGTTQNWSKTTPAGTIGTATDDLTFYAKIKVNSITAAGIITKYNGSSGFQFRINASGQLECYGFNAASGNYRGWTTTVAVPVGKWITIYGTLDMSGFTTTTNKAMIDGADTPLTLAAGGTSPTSFVQAGNLEIGSTAASAFFNGKVAQAAVFNGNASTITEAIVNGYDGQSLTGAESNNIGTWKFDGNGNDSNAAGNTLTAGGSATATNADGPFGGQAGGTISSTLDYGIVMSVAFSTNTTIIVQAPEGCAFTTSGTLSSIDYAGAGTVPFGFPRQTAKWTLRNTYRVNLAQASPSVNVWYNPGSLLYLPVGEWNVLYSGSLLANNTTQSSGFATLSNANNTESDAEFTVRSTYYAGNVTVMGNATRSKEISVPTAATYYLNLKTDTTGGTTISLGPASEPTIISAVNGYL